MAARSIAKGSISFGLVAIPVKLYPATQPQAGLSFNLLDKETGGRLKQQYVRASDGEIVERSQMVKGYEFAKGQYVTFTPEELKSLEERGSQAIEIEEFVPRAAVDPIHYDKPYYLGPERGGEKAYRLLSEVMTETDRVAIARYAARGKQYLVMLRPAEKGLVMQQLLYADEVRPMSDVPIPDVEPKHGELQLARQLVEQISKQTFDVKAYKDEVRERINADIQRKIEGHEIEQLEEASEPAQVIDLMEALKASLAAHAAATSAQAEQRRPAKLSSDSPPARKRSKAGAE
ncbi:MAG: Ku protein [Deltaproteobacteria bacterium]|nr:Ku protein [Deltaproteobacteria bacterium]